jgi:hypothetical protein
MMRAQRRHTDGHDCDGQYDSVSIHHWSISCS